MYRFTIEITPDTNEPSLSDIRGGEAIACVNVDDEAFAIELANAYIRRFRFVPGKVLTVLQLQPEGLPDLHTDEALLIRRALEKIVAVDFVVVPIEERPAGTPVEKQYLWNIE